MDNFPAEPHDSFDAFLEESIFRATARDEYEQQLESLTPTVNDTLRHLDIRLYTNAPEEEISRNRLALYLDTLSRLRNQNQSLSTRELTQDTQQHVHELIAAHELTILDLKNLIINTAENPHAATETKHRAMARRLQTGELDADSAWYTAYDILILGDRFDATSPAAQRGFHEGQADIARREESKARLATAIAALTGVVVDALPPTTDPTVAQYTALMLSSQLALYKQFPAEAESAIDEILRDAQLQHLKPAILSIFETVTP